ncbi:sensor histidine kinase [Demequina aurantiaca]|uniref:sensor histidine kinase n=1 Tax=Demequina aurantiaca TaxID=676200 RepID=UPI000780A70B|nr:sensor histidine kinase [Demequina aurantiaca]
MAHDALRPVFVGLQVGLHGLLVLLAALVIGRAAFAPYPGATAAVVIAIVMVATYAFGIWRVGARRVGNGIAVWLGVLTLEWIALLWFTPDAAYLVFPLFFLYLHLLGRAVGAAVVVTTTVVAVVALGAHGGWSVGGVVGPLVGAGVALLIGYGYESLSREASERERLLAELTAAQGQLAASEHESGVLAERARLAREIHDTVAQGLSSIQMLLHAAERADPEGPGVPHVRLARETAAANLADARRFIRELTPPDLDAHGLEDVLHRFARDEWASHGLVVDVQVRGSETLPMHLQTALLRIVQGAMANVIQHAQADSATVELVADSETVSLRVSDDGVGFDVAAVSGAPSSHRDSSFGLRATRERVDQLGGECVVESSIGAGTVVAVMLDLEVVS